MKTRTYGTTTSEEILAAAKEYGPYPMTMAGDEAKLIEMLVNQGIDSHLEACFMPSRGDSYDWKTEQVTDWLTNTKLHCIVSPESMPVLLRRLHEHEENEGEFAEAAMSLRCAILETLGFEEV